MQHLSASEVSKLRTGIPAVLVANDERVARWWNQLIPAASHLFMHQGFAAVSMSQIAGASGIPLRTLRRYAPEKEGVLLLVLDRIMALYDEAMRPVLADLSHAPRALVQAMDAYYRVIDQNTDKVMLAYRETKSLTREGRAYLKRREIETNAVFARIIGTGVEAEQFRPTDPNLVAYNIVTLGQMWAAKRWYFRERVALREFISEQSRFVLGALIVPGSEGCLERIEDWIAT